MKEVKFNNGLVRMFSDSAADAYVKAGVGVILENKEKEEKEILDNKEEKKVRVRKTK